MLRKERIRSLLSVLITLALILGMINTLPVKAQVSPTPTGIPSPTLVPTAEPTIIPTVQPTIGPTIQPTATPVAVSTLIPTQTPIPATPTPTTSLIMSPTPTIIPPVITSPVPTIAITATPTATPKPSEEPVPVIGGSNIEIKPTQFDTPVVQEPTKPVPVKMQKPVPISIKYDLHPATADNIASTVYTNIIVPPLSFITRTNQQDFYSEKGIPVPTQRGVEGAGLGMISVGGWLLGQERIRELIIATRNTWQRVFGNIQVEKL